MTPAPTKPSEALRAARELLSPEGAWITQNTARDANGNGLWGNEPGAVCWCAIGALQHVNDSSDFVGLLGLPWLSDAMGTWPGHFNNKKTHAEVLAAFDHAIALAEEVGQ